MSVDVQAPAQKRHGAAPPGPCAMVLFGAGGDLTKRLVFPALYNLSRTGLLPDKFALIGVDLADLTTEAWVKNLSDMLESFTKGGSGEFQASSIDPDALARLTQRMIYLRGDLTNADTYHAIGKTLDETSKQHGTEGNALFYLAVADRFFGGIVDQLGEAGLANEGEGDGASWRRVVIEKPFGHDLPSAIALNAQVLKTLREDQVFRIDHFLGKETVQNIMALRFANGFFEPGWTRDRIDHVQITVSETVGVEGRGKFYEQTGALRDMVPNHVFQLLAMTAMEPPISFGADAVRQKKSDVLAAMPPVAVEDAVRGQYDAGEVLGKKVVAYRAEPNVAKDSAVETYVALKLAIENWRWAGVPFYLRTGKYMSRRMTEIAIRFKDVPMRIFLDTKVEDLQPNWLVIQIQPDEGIALQFEVKRPGALVELAPVSMNFQYKDWFPQEPNVGYETLLYDVMIGDATLFQRADQVEGGWRVVQKVLDDWAAKTPDDFPNYVAGSAGPAAADALIARDGGRSWRPLVPAARS